MKTLLKLVVPSSIHGHSYLSRQIRTEERLDSSQKQLSSVQQTYTVKVSKLEEDLQKLNVVTPELQREVVHLRIALNNANKSNKMASDRIQEISTNNQKQTEEIQNWTARLYTAEKTMRP